MGNLNATFWRRYSYLWINESVQSPAINTGTDSHYCKLKLISIELIFTIQPILVMESGVPPSVYQNYHHQTIFAKFNLKRFYPPPYEGIV